MESEGRDFRVGCWGWGAGGGALGEGKGGGGLVVDQVTNERPLPMAGSVRPLYRSLRANGVKVRLRSSLPAVCENVYVM